MLRFCCQPVAGILLLWICGSVPRCMAFYHDCSPHLVYGRRQVQHPIVPNLFRARSTYTHSRSMPIRSANSNNSNVKESGSSWGRKLEGLSQRITRYTSKAFKNSAERKERIDAMKKNLKLIIKGVMKNLKEGEVGKRGEEWVAVQLSITLVIIFGVPYALMWLVSLSGYVYFLSGIWFILNSIWHLREFTSPFITPSVGNELIETGVFRLVRHPMYGGLVLTCLGISILSNSVERLLLTALLLYVLDKKATAEENLLQKVHPQTYSSYVVGKKKILPFIL